jgi:aminoglycoside phosphotransferase (APT) family kinase protein
VDPEIRSYLVGETSMRGEELTDLTEKYSGARLERVVLEDGRSFVLKRLPKDGDWLTRATGSTGRIFTLWSSGLLHEVGDAVDHTIVDCVETADGWVVVMRDASAELVPARVMVSRDDSRRLLRGIAELHAVDVDASVKGLCSIGARYRLFAPGFHRQDAGPGPHPMREAIVNGWDTFGELVPADVAAAVTAVHDDPGPLERALDQFPTSFLHGDAKLENVGYGAEQMVFIDWGDLTGFGPAEIDVAWYVVRGSARIDADPGDLFADYESRSGRKLDLKALDLVCLGSLAQMGFRMANSATLGRPETRETGSSQLDWWTRRARPALDRLPY